MTPAAQSGVGIIKPDTSPSETTGEKKKKVEG